MCQYIESRPKINVCEDATRQWLVWYYITIIGLHLNIIYWLHGLFDYISKSKIRKVVAPILMLLPTVCPNHPSLFFIHQRKKCDFFCSLKMMPKNESNALTLTRHIYLLALGKSYMKMMKKTTQHINKVFVLIYSITRHCYFTLT